MNAKRTFWYFSMVVSGVSNQERGGAGGESQATQVSYNSWGGRMGKKKKYREIKEKKSHILQGAPWIVGRLSRHACWKQARPCILSIADLPQTTLSICDSSLSSRGVLGALTRFGGCRFVSTSCRRPPVGNVFDRLSFTLVKRNVNITLSLTRAHSMSTTRRATSRVHKGGGVPGARRVGGSAGATREIHELKTKIQELSDDNKALKVKELTPQKKTQHTFRCVCTRHRVSATVSLNCATRQNHAIRHTPTVTRLDTPYKTYMYSNNQQGLSSSALK